MVNQLISKVNNENTFPRRTIYEEELNQYFQYFNVLWYDPNNTNEYKHKLTTAFLKNKKPITLINSNSFKIFHPIQKNYINYTIIKNNLEHNYKYNTMKENDTIKKNSKTLRIINEVSITMPICLMYFSAKWAYRILITTSISMLYRMVQ